MAVGDITTIPIKDGGGTTRQVPFEEQADGSLAPVHFSRGAEGAVLATQTTLAAVLAELEAKAHGTDAEPTVAQLKGSKVAEALDEGDLSGGDLTLSAEPEFVRIYNTDDTNDGVFTVNGIALAVPAGTSLETGVAGTGSTTVSVTGSTEFIFQRLT